MRGFSGILSLCMLVALARAEVRLEVVATFPATEAGQGVAVDADYFYAINNQAVGKYRKTDGVRVDGWVGEKSGPVHHLNAGIVREGRLICAHSNFPLRPEEGSLEIFDVRTLKPLERHVFDNPPGSLTWAVPFEGDWLACFAHYKPSSDPALTRLVRFDVHWKSLTTWTFPASVVAKFGKNSSSCGGFGPDGRLYVSGHDAKELYVLELPPGGGEARHLGTIAFPSEGQAFAWDPARPDHLYSIRRKTKEVVVSRLVR